MRFDDLLSRADDETLQTLLGDAVIRLLKLLDFSLATPTKLQEILLGLHSPESLLLSREHRILLIYLLRPEQAKILAAILGKPKHQDVFDALEEIKIRHVHDLSRALFEFFELAPPQPIAPNQLAPTATSLPKYPLFAHQRTGASHFGKSSRDRGL